MTEGIERRYQVFVSSTYEDLIEERREVSQALLELDCIPAGMELFAAGNDDQWTIIKRVIDDCDYYILILAGRYGSTDPAGMGYTEKEYRYAVDIGKPVLAFVHSDIKTIPLNKSENVAENKQKLEAFQKLAKQKMIKYWTSASELGSVVSRSIVRVIKDYPSPGWIRGNFATDADSYKEILSLKRQIDQLKGQTKNAAPSIFPSADSLKSGKEKFDLRAEVTFLNETDGKSTTFYWPIKTSIDEIMFTLGPILLENTTEETVKNRLDTLFVNREWAEIEADEMFRNLKYKNFSIGDDAFLTIKVQLSALGLIERSAIGSINGRPSRVLKLSSQGEMLMYNLRALRKTKTRTKPANTSRVS